MSDQAETLRRMMSQRRARPLPENRAPVIYYAGDSRGRMVNTRLMHQMSQVIAQEGVRVRIFKQGDSLAEWDYVPDLVFSELDRDRTVHSFGSILGSLLMISSDSHSFAESYQNLRFLNKYYRINRIAVIVNQVTTAQEGSQIFSRLERDVQILTGIKIVYLGHCQKDEKNTQSVLKQKFLVNLDYGTSSQQWIKVLAGRLASFCADPCWEEGKSSIND